MHTVAAGARVECAKLLCCLMAIPVQYSCYRISQKVWEVFHCPHFKICSMGTPDTLALDEEADRQLCAAYCDVSIPLEVSTSLTHRANVFLGGRIIRFSVCDEELIKPVVLVDCVAGRKSWDCFERTQLTSMRVPVKHYWGSSSSRFGVFE